MPDLEKTSDVFKALSDATRLKILRIIQLNGSNLCVGRIAQQLGISQPAVSQHLKILKNAGLVKPNRLGYHIHYEVNNTGLEPYQMNIITLLESIKYDEELNINCEHQGNSELCNE